MCVLVFTNGYELRVGHTLETVVAVATRHRARNNGWLRRDSSGVGQYVYGSVQESMFEACSLYLLAHTFSPATVLRYHARRCGRFCGSQKPSICHTPSNKLQGTQPPFHWNVWRDTPSRHTCHYTVPMSPLGMQLLRSLQKPHGLLLVVSAEPSGEQRLLRTHLQVRSAARQRAQARVSWLGRARGCRPCACPAR